MLSDKTQITVLSSTHNVKWVWKSVSLLSS